MKQISKTLAGYSDYEIWELDDGYNLSGVHQRSDCTGSCVIHNPSGHHMSTWRLHWRDDRGIFERICEHMVGHPDPDQFEYWKATEQEYEAVHGCDGCCAAPKPDQVPSSNLDEEDEIARKEAIVENPPRDGDRYAH